jgi:hypothetical protein
MGQEGAAFSRAAQGVSMTPDQALVGAAMAALKQNLDRANAFFGGLSDAQLQAEIGPGKNRLIYLWGHLIAVHDAMLPLLGIGPRLHPELDAAFLTGADKAVADLPSAARLKELWDEVHGRLLGGIGAFDAGAWAQRHTVVSEADFATNPLRNRFAVLLSRTNHVAYHLGQVVLAPK